MTKDLMINILMADRCTKAEAEKFIQKGATICPVDDLSFLNEYNEALGDEPITIEAIKAGTVTDFSFVEYEGNEYYIAYVL